MSEPHPNACIVEIIPETPTVARVVLELEGAFAFLPGQWVDFGVPRGDSVAVGGYSLASEPSTLPRIELGIRLNEAHTVSRWIHHEAKPGDRVIVQGGSGECVYRPSDGDSVVFVAGGIGITPPLSMIRGALKSEVNFGAHLFYSARSADELAFLTDLKALATDPRFELYTTTSGTARDDGWTGRRGRWDVETIHSGRERAVFYLFGPPPMVDGLWEGLLAAGVPERRLRTERWW